MPDEWGWVKLSGARLIGMDGQQCREVVGFQLLSDVEGLSTTAGIYDVRIVEGELGTRARME